MERCFVIQPFDRDKFDRRYKDPFKPAIEEAGYEPYRVDEDPSVSIPIDDIEKGIRETAVCFAEITTDNANVWYELGYAFASRKPVVMVCERNVRVKFPFDVQHRKITLYDSQSLSDFGTLKSEIIARLKAIDKTPIPVGDISKQDPQHEIQLSFVAISSRCFWTIGMLGDLLVLMIHTNWHVTNMPGSRLAARILEALLLEPQGEILLADVEPSRQSPMDPHWEEIEQGKTAKIYIRFHLKLSGEPTSEPLDVKIVVVDQLGKRHTLDPITLKRRG